MSQEGISEVEVWLHDPILGSPALVGKLLRRDGRRGDTIHFEYDSQWIAAPKAGVRPFALDPQLPVYGGQVTARAGADQLTGAFQDCSPDRWGKLLMDRREVIRARESGARVRSLRPWDYLVGVHDEARMGALRLCEAGGSYLDDSGLSSPPVTDLRELEAIAVQVDKGGLTEDEESDKWFSRLIVPGATMGGARPKASVRDLDGRLSMAKFPAYDDRHDVGLWEFVTYRLSVAAGITMPAARPYRFSSRGTTYLVERFDRATDDGRRAYASAFTLMDVDHSESSGYVDLVEVIENQGVPAAINEDLRQLFRRAVFNVLIGNRDDHLRNHGFLRDPDGWRLSPAFDVNPNPDKAEHVLAIGLDDPTPDTRLLLDTREFYRLTRKDADGILEQVRTVVRRWADEAHLQGAGRYEIEGMRGVVDPER